MFHFLKSDMKTHSAMMLKMREGWKKGTREDLKKNMINFDWWIGQDHDHSHSHGNGSFHGHWSVVILSWYLS